MARRDNTHMHVAARRRPQQIEVRRVEREVKRPAHVTDCARDRVHATHHVTARVIVHHSHDNQTHGHITHTNT
jgi:hypothetical protein